MRLIKYHNTSQERVATTEKQNTIFKPFKAEIFYLLQELLRPEHGLYLSHIKYRALL